MRKPKRVISKTKVYGFNPWMDQLDAINQIIADTGEKESTVLRKLIDEALTASAHDRLWHQAAHRFFDDMSALGESRRRVQAASSASPSLTLVDPHRSRRYFRF